MAEWSRGRVFGRRSGGAVEWRGTVVEWGRQKHRRATGDAKLGGDGGVSKVLEGKI